MGRLAAVGFARSSCLGAILAGCLGLAPALAQPASGAPAAADDCSVDAINAKDPAIPDNGWDPGLTARQKADLATHYAGRGREYARCQQWKNALANYSIAVQLDAHNLTNFVGRAEIYMNMDDFAHAVADYTSAISLNSQAHPYLYIRSVYASRGYAYLQLHQYPPAIADLNMVVNQLATASAVGMKPVEEQRRRLADAYLGAGDTAKAAMQLNSLISSGAGVWSDYLAVGRAQLQAGDTERGIATLNTALQKLADSAQEADKPAKRSRIQLALAQAYMKRAADGDQLLARQAYVSALADDPGNADAKAGLALLPAPPPRPTFQPPGLQPVVMPPGINDLTRDLPGPFCSQEQENGFLDTVSTASAQVNGNMQIVGHAIDDLLQRRADYDHSTLLAYSEKIDYLAAFDDEWKRLDQLNRQLRQTGFQLRAFFKRVVATRGLIIPCRDQPSAAGGPHS